MTTPVTLYSDIHELMTNAGAVEKNARGPMSGGDLGVIQKAAMIVSGGKVVWSGPRAKIPRRNFKIKKEIAVEGNVFPGFVDCHTHSLFLGDRSDEFEMRNLGATYQDIAKRGGGILSTVKKTRAGSVNELIAALQPRLEYFADQGVTTVEVKSGYGLTLKDEIKMLTAIQKSKAPVRVVPTFLGAHALPPEFTSRQAYLDELKKGLAEIKKKNLAERIDIFIEENYFSIDEGREYLRAARELGFKITIHADQLTRTGAALLASELGALSADHVIRITEDDVAALAKSQTTCVLLPTSDLYLRCPYPPARALIDRGARVALSTDFNPGTAPSQNIQLVGVLARLEMKMTLPEVFTALTLGGAHALGMGEARGALVEGFDADFFVSSQSWREFFYDLKPIAISSVWIGGAKRSRSIKK